MILGARGESESVEQGSNEWKWSEDHEARGCSYDDDEKGS